MLKQLWMTGILAAFLAFGIKTGIGLGAQVCNNTITWYKKWGFITGCLLIYLLLFLGMYYLITGLNLLNYLDQLTSLFKYGMILHFAVALGLFAWGVRLLIPQQLDQFKMSIAKATGKTQQEKEVEHQKTRESLKKTIEEIQKEESVKAKTEGKKVEGFEMVDEKSEDTKLTASGSEWMVMVIVSGILVLLFAGWKKNKI